MAKKEEPKKSGDTHHVHEYLNTKPPHNRIRAEACDCSIGRNHSSYESP